MTQQITPAAGMPRWRKVLLWMVAVGALFTVVGALAVVLVVRHYAQGLPSVEQLKSGYDPPQISRIFASDDTLLSTAFTQRRTVVAFDDITDATKLAFLASEDAYFYEHSGIKPTSIIRAQIANLRAGKKVQGGSTITQQVAEIVLLGHSRAYVQKIRESVLAWRLENYLTKDEILSLYLNHVLLGHGRYGVEEAARFYFGKHASEMDLAEAALLAGVLPSPRRYSPRRAPQLALRKRQYVLDQMLEKGFVTPQYHREVTATPLRLAPRVDIQSTLAPEVVTIARRAIRRIEKQEERQGGYTIHTTIEPRLQVLARKAIRNTLTAYADRHKLWPPYVSKKIRAWGKPFKGHPRAYRTYVGVVEAVDDQAGELRVRVGDVVGRIVLAEEDRYNPKHLRASEFARPEAVLRVRVTEKPPEDRLVKLRLALGPQAALAAVDVRSRDVVALVGSFEAIPGGLDRARRSKRQPGSAFKPFVFSAAFNVHAATPASVLELKKKGRGATGDEPPYKINVRNALAQSNNEAAVQLFRAAGPKHVVKWAHRLGIKSKLKPDLSLALGAYEVSPLELANAYATFASGGFFQDPRFLKNLAGPNGREIVLPARTERKRVLSSDEAYLTTSLLRSVVDDGLARRAKAVGVPIAAKTGTTNGSKDAWLVGFSTELSVAVWVGFDDAHSLGKREGGSRTAAPAFVEFMKAAHEGRPAADFHRPPGIVVVSVDPVSGLLPRIGQMDTVNEEFLSGTAPDEVAPEPVPDTNDEMPYILLPAADDRPIPRGPLVSPYPNP